MAAVHVLLVALQIQLGFRVQGLQGYLAHKKTNPPRTTVGPYAQANSRVLGEGVFL